MGVVAFDLERTVQAPIELVFARLADIGGYSDWMPEKGSMLRRTRQTSPGELGLGTTYLDETSYGKTPGDVVEFRPPHALVFHWWERSKRGRLRLEGWPGYRLDAADDGTTPVRHHAELHTHGFYRPATPVLHRLAVKERTATIDALVASFESSR